MNIIHLTIIVPICFAICLINYYKLFSRSYLLFINSIFFIQGVEILLIGNYVPRFYGLPILIITSFFLFNKSLFLELKAFKFNLFSKIDLIMGLIILAMHITLSFLFFDTSFGTNDLFISLTYIILILANLFLPQNFESEYNFFKAFSFFLVLFLVIPVKLIDLSDLEQMSGEALFVEIMVAKPLAEILHVLDFNLYVDGKTIHYFHNNELQILYIAESCSGIFSVALYCSVLFSYFFAYYRVWNIELVAFLFLGIMIFYISNLVRMTTILYIGINFGPEMLLLFHEYLGWIFFTLILITLWPIFPKENDLGVENE